MTEYSMQPFFSIITVCLNAGKELVRTTNSILDQQFQDYQIIIKDGISNDGVISDEIFNDDKIVKIVKKDKGIYDAMNQALEYAVGEYVLFLNAADIFADNCTLSNYYDTIMANDFPDLIYCDYKTTGLNHYVQSPIHLTDFFLYRTMLCHQVCMIKRKTYLKYGTFDTAYKVCADYDFLLRLLIGNKSKYAHFQSLGVISTSGGFSAQNNKLAKKEVEEIRRKHYKSKYYYYKLLLFLTFPSLRERVLRNNNAVSVIYQKFVNKINKL